MRTVLVSKNVPWPPNSGEKQRTLGIVRMLAELGSVTVVAASGPHDDPAAAEAEGVRVTATSLATPTPTRWLGRAIRHRSITAGRWCDPALAAALRAEIVDGVDAVVVEHVQLAGLLPTLPTEVVTVLDMHNVESELTRRLALSSHGPRRILYRGEAAALRHLERRTVDAFDIVTVVSEADRSQLAGIAPTRPTIVVPNALDADHPPLPGADGPVVCFVGLLSWAPNADAAVDFATRTWPLVRNQVPGARLLLVGRDPTPAVTALACDDIDVTGTVEDVAPYYAQSRVAVAPLLAGGGSRLKILEALSWGRPVVATPVGAEGLEDLVGRGVVTATDPAALATAVVELLGDPVRAQHLGQLGADAVREDHSWAAATTHLRGALTARTTPPTTQPTQSARRAS